MTPASPAFDNTAHRFYRKGRDLQVSVMTVQGGAEYGHVLVFGAVTDGCLVRVHSRCLYGESLGAEDCDCGPELSKAMDMIQKAGQGVVIYLEQEGRGAGLVAKARGHHECERAGTDTFTGYKTLGYPPDGRTYDRAAQSLLTLGLSSVRLLTNNPAKVQALLSADLSVEMVPLRTRARTKVAVRYLNDKRLLRGHVLPIDGVSWPPEVRPAFERKLRSLRRWSSYGSRLNSRRRTTLCLPPRNGDSSTGR